ncbi:TPA: hypothetical protein ACH3X2_004464 [Trebouxia sp. C0005]
MLQTQQRTVPPIKATFLTQTASPTDTETHRVALSSSPSVHSPRSPASSSSPSAVGPPSPPRNGKKKARNRPPKHIRKGTSVTRRPDEDPHPSQPDCAGISAREPAGAAVRHDTAASTAVDRQLASPLSSRVMSAPIRVPIRSDIVSEDENTLKLEAFSSPKWLGTGFSDRIEASKSCSVGPRCSGPMIDTASGQFTYFANSMW